MVMVTNLGCDDDEGTGAHMRGVREEVRLGHDALGHVRGRPQQPCLGVRRALAPLQLDRIQEAGVWERERARVLACITTTTTTIRHDKRWR